jgi:ABC-type multidrug transport system fused ATPase/permease subunit
MTLGELETAVRERVRMLVVVLDDGAYGSEVHIAWRLGLSPDDAIFETPDFVEVARSLGAEAVRLHHVDELPAVLGAARGARPPARRPLSHPVDRPVAHPRGAQVVTIEITGLTHAYGDAVSVRDLSLTIEDGEFLVLLGPSGCGKTTTMRCVVGLERPQAGTIRIGGRTVFDAGQRIDVPANKRNTGMVFQSYAVWPHKTVYENVAFRCRCRSSPRRRRASASRRRWSSSD